MCVCGTRKLRKKFKVVIDYKLFLMRVYPIAGLKETNEPETDIDVEEEENVG